MFNAQKTIGQIAAENPSAVRVFEDLKIDYCCHGGQSCEEASKTAGVTPSELYAMIMTSGMRLGEEPARDWMGGSLRELIFHLVEKHHPYTRSELDQMIELADKAVAAHRENHRELIQLHGLLRRLREELRPHLLKEEQILFPFIAMLEDAIQRGRSMPVPPFDTLENPIDLMIREHQSVGDQLGQIRAVTDDFHIPIFSSANYRMLMRTLEDFERNLHLHLHLENNILFPRARAMESSGAKIEYEFANSCGEC